MTSRFSLAVKTALVILAAHSLAGCNTLERLSEVGEPPRTSNITDPTQAPGYQQVSLPMPAPTVPTAGTNSLWRPGSRSFFKDQRANDVGDIVTVSVSIADSGTLKNNTTTSTANSESYDPLVLAGLEKSISHVFSGADATSLFSFGSSGGVTDSGSAARSEAVTINLAAEVTQKLPNGNLVISGKQELRVNGELRELGIQGIIRPEDITSLNTISSSQIAEARIVYGGRGTLTDVQGPRYGQQVFDTISPF